ncbi:MAG: hypothetical protein AAFX06_15250 [Planctomycetota bacterium]
MRQLNCPTCDALIQVDQTDSAGRVQCPNCGAVVETNASLRPTVSEPFSEPKQPKPNEPINPYATTILTNDYVETVDRPVGNPSLIPGYCLMVLSTLWGAILVIQFLFVAVNAMNAPAANPDWGIVLSRFGTATVMIAVHTFIVFGGYSMTKCQNKGSSTAACILAMIPCCCSPFWVLGMPFGLWGLIVHDKTPFKK